MGSSTSLRDALQGNQRFLSVAGSLVLFSLGLWVLYHELASTSLPEIRSALGQVPPLDLFLACLGAAGSYLVLTGFDVLALACVSRPLPYRRVALASVTATAVGYNIGMAVLSAGAVRLRLYTAWGLSAAEVGMVAWLVTLTFAIDTTAVGGWSLLFEPELVGTVLQMHVGAARALGALLLLLVAAYIGSGSLRRSPIRIRNWQFQLPSAGIAAGQVALACLDLACACLALYALLPKTSPLTFSTFIGIYVAAVLAGVISHVPGGLGVFETVILLALPDMPRHALLASILLYRLIYYLLPLMLVALLAVGVSATAARKRVSRRLEVVRRIVAWMAPVVMGGAVFLAGVVLLFSGSAPAVWERMHFMHGLVPLPVLEVSHMLGSLIGLALVILAQGLYRRVDAAYHLTFWLLLAGALASLLKGLDYEEAIFSVVVLGILRGGRHAFYRKASVVASIFTPGWFVPLFLVLAATIWLGLFAYRHVEYSHDLWWHFTFRGDAPRFLRASLLLTLAAFGVGLLRLMRPAPPPPGQASAMDLERAAPIVANAPNADAALALVGDKRLLFDDVDQAFLMYQVRGQHWIAMGDPVGPPAAREPLAWRFRELADRHGARTVFYQVNPENLPLYLDLGLSAVKLGEEAIVPLKGFTLKGSRLKGLRQSHHRAERCGLRFELIPPGAVSALMPVLRTISDTWLTEKHTHEKRFSLGAFHPDYLSRFPCALVWQEGRLLAFANVWTSANWHEISIDLMRYLPDAPGGVMDYLFVELMQFGAREGYQHFNLGMAPLSGLEQHPLAPAWHRMGTLIFRQGEVFYNFKGLRAYKDKFNPIWRPKYLAAPGGLALPIALLDVAALIAGDIKGVFLK
ncbi:bifunctional lysylphosphatidylglycerol flippase/synthetase MprF [Noviherbaspirillum denitrificans]|uniref:Phosphatidylglycerol lysyltransferase n=1 Tax=Noviherbaspirillum denitrificans TaxID=1968433 RepID=A0A254TCE6_9BURK|nr:bifunctional lysylphosphatidylglycerol flippase/synthetase MprF [Noviherbaspirillum denitrificans]OWW20311.1 hypothetical protein AYR66_13220 [Noviherbaspirillum denitrificans]